MFSCKLSKPIVSIVVLIHCTAFFILARNASAADTALPPFPFKSDLPVSAWMMLGPVPEPDLKKSSNVEAALKANLPSFLGTPQTPTINTNALIWKDDQPCRWAQAPCDARGLVRVEEMIGPSRQGDITFFYRTIQHSRSQEVVLALTANAPVAAWLNGDLLRSKPDTETTEFWTPPGKDYILLVVTLKEGVNHLLIKSANPAGHGTWVFGARFLTSGSFRKGLVAYPRWQFSSPAPWSLSAPPKSVRWGDPAIQQFLGMTEHRCQLTCAWIGTTPPKPLQIRMGDSFALQLPPLPAKIQSAILQLHAEAIQAASGDDLMAISAAQYSWPGASETQNILIGKAIDMPQAQIAQTKANDSGSVEPTRTDLESALNALAAFSPAQYTDPYGVRLAAWSSSLDFLNANARSSTAIPKLWQRFAAPIASPKATIPYTLFVPTVGEEVADQPRPLVIVLPPEGEDEFYVIDEEPLLAAEASRLGWALAIPQISGRRASLLSYDVAVQAVRNDIIKRLKIDPRRQCIIALGDAAETGMALAFNHSEIFSGMASVEGRWKDLGDWNSMLASAAPRPALCFLIPQDEEARQRLGTDPMMELENGLVQKDGPWTRISIDSLSRRKAFSETFDFFTSNPLSLRPERLVMSGAWSDNHRAWLGVSSLIEPKQSFFIEAQWETTHTLSILGSNIASFNITPSLAPFLPLETLSEIKIEQDDLVQIVRVVGASALDQISLHLIRREDNSLMWEARDASKNVAQNTQDRLGVLLDNFPVASTSKQSGMGQLIARAIRQRTGADVVLIPASEVHNGQAKGDVRTSDISHWGLDARLCTMTLSTARLLQIVESDYAGPRLLTTDGLHAIAAAENVQAIASPQWIASNGYLMDTRTNATVFTSSTLMASPGTVFPETVVVAGWRDLLLPIAAGEELQDIHRGFKLSEEKTKEAYNLVHELRDGQREILFWFFQTLGYVEGEEPDIRLLPRKWATKRKFKITP